MARYLERISALRNNFARAHVEAEKLNAKAVWAEGWSNWGLGLWDTVMFFLFLSSFFKSFLFCFVCLYACMVYFFLKCLFHKTKLFFGFTDVLHGGFEYIKTTRLDISRGCAASFS